MWPRLIAFPLLLLTGDAPASAPPYVPSLNPERIVYVVDVLQDCGGAMRHVDEPACFRLTNARMPEMVVMMPEEAPLVELLRAAIAMSQNVEIIVTRRPK